MLEVLMLGPVEAVVDGERRPIGSAAQRALLAGLALDPGTVVSIDRLIDIVWQGGSPASASAGLHVYVSRLRKRIGSRHLLTEPAGYRLTGTTTDVARYEELARSEHPTDLEEAAGLWRGDPFGDLQDHEHFRITALRLRGLRDALDERRVELALDTDPAWALAQAQALCESEPLRENRWALLARALAVHGRNADGLRALDAARRALSEVGLEPSPLLTDLEDQLLSPPPAPARPSDPPVGGVPVPGLVTPVVGRGREIRELGELLDSKRLVTLIGPGGVGKTKLAAALGVEATAEARWCDLAAHDDASAVTAAVARAVGAPVSGDIEESLVAYLRHRGMLIVVDNCEHLIGETARVVELLLATCPKVSVLTTSREPLSLPAEWVLRIDPLDPDTAAVELFVQRSEAAGAPVSESERPAVVGICRAVDGLPLAIEMAAARTPSLGIDELARRLEHDQGILAAGPRTGDGRHRTLAQVVDWSMGLLAPEELAVLRRASVFAGDFDLAAAEQVIGGDDVPPATVAGLVARLVDRSLLRATRSADGRRFRMLATVRRVVVGTLSDDELADLNRRHASYYADRAEEWGDRLLGPEEARYAARIDQELPDLRTAVYRSARSAPEFAVRICASLYPLVYHRLRSDVAVWGEDLSPAVEALGHPLVPTVAALSAIAAQQRGDLTEALERCRRAAASGRGDEQLARVLEVETDLLVYLGRPEEGCRSAERMLAVARRAGDVTNEIMAMVSLALARLYAGDRKGADEAVAEVRSKGEHVDSDTVAAWADYVAGEVELDRNPEVAAVLLDRALERARATGARFVVGVAAVSAASVSARYGDPDLARERLATVIRHWRSEGDWVHQSVTLRHLVVMLERLGDDEGAAILLGGISAREPVAYGDDAARLEEVRRRLSDRLGAEGIEALVDKGANVDDDELVSIALERLEQPGSVRPGRSGTGRGRT